MTINLADVIPQLLPKAIAWAEQKSSEILSSGTPLDEPGMRLARAVGVARPELIRVSIVSALPLPDDDELKTVALATGLLGPQTAGLTLGYGIYICTGLQSARLLSHECRHVQQYERAGSVRGFLPLYLAQVAAHGYHDAPYEVDARAHEIDVA